MKRVTIIIIVLALVFVGIMCIGCGGGEDLEGAKETAEGLWQAFMEGNSDDAWELVTAESKESVNKENLISGASEGVNNVILEEVTISGDEARVWTALDMESLDRELEFDTILFREDGEWKVSLPDTENEINEALGKMQEEIDTSQETGE
ncbi:MAG: hypothetical protein JW854_02580 [Actinobacteria bacterium]|nr:hypothetical protein [Actinomycetota bacterium]